MNKKEFSFNIERKNMKVLLTGAYGQLGYDYQILFNSLGIEYLATDYEDLNITDNKKLEDFFLKNRNFDIIINCAAYNDVDKAETDEKNGLKNAQNLPKTALSELSNYLSFNPFS